jgi:hypothetical protein
MTLLTLRKAMIIDLAYKGPVNHCSFSKVLELDHDFGILRANEIRRMGNEVLVIQAIMVHERTGTKK